MKRRKIIFPAIYETTIELNYRKLPSIVTCSTIHIGWKKYKEMSFKSKSKKKNAEIFFDKFNQGFLFPLFL